MSYAIEIVFSPANPPSRDEYWRPARIWSQLVPDHGLRPPETPKRPNGAFGKDLVVTGTWRDGYEELTFTAGWQEEPKSTPIPAVVTLAGWIDNDTAAGRMKVEGRADGQWTAARQ
jgi:hypothetical protein